MSHGGFEGENIWMLSIGWIGSGLTMVLTGTDFPLSWVDMFKLVPGILSTAYVIWKWYQDVKTLKEKQDSFTRYTKDKEESLGQNNIDLP
jgi:hypothetical protein